VAIYCMPIRLLAGVCWGFVGWGQLREGGEARQERCAWALRRTGRRQTGSQAAWDAPAKEQLDGRAINCTNTPDLPHLDGDVQRGRFKGLEHDLKGRERRPSASCPGGARGRPGGGRGQGLAGWPWLALAGCCSKQQGCEAQGSPSTTGSGAPPRPPTPPLPAAHLCHLLPVGLGVHGRLRQQYGVLLHGTKQGPDQARLRLRLRLQQQRRPRYPKARLIGGGAAHTPRARAARLPGRCAAVLLG
jgi:hypothetical protein